MFVFLQTKFVIRLLEVKAEERTRQMDKKNWNKTFKGQAFEIMD